MLRRELPAVSLQLLVFLAAPAWTEIPQRNRRQRQIASRLCDMESAESPLQEKPQALKPIEGR